jgi:hypothetical protein
MHTGKQKERKRGDGSEGERQEELTLVSRPDWIRRKECGVGGAAVAVLVVMLVLVVIKIRGNGCWGRGRAARLFSPRRQLLN